MSLSSLDWTIVVSFFSVCIFIGIFYARKAGNSAKEFFLSGQNMPWWLLGVSMVATTFSADTPNLVTDIVRSGGVFNNWSWWVFLITGMVTVFVYAKLWRRSGVLTDLEFYEIRYSGREAAFLRGFRALYLGVFFNVVVMASVCLAAIKYGSLLFGLSKVETLIYASSIAVIYSSLGGLRGVLLTDFLQFFIAMIGTIGIALFVLDMPEIGGIDRLISHPNVIGNIDLMPDFDDPTAILMIFVIPLTIQWWSAYYPGAEPGGGGYIAQRILAAKDEKNALLATLLFNVMHYAVRPWPWIIVALASLVIYPDLASISEAFPQLDASIIGHDLAYPAMLVNLPSGLLGIVVASVAAAFMSTISTHLNWGSSYIVHDFYQRFVKPDASQKELVAVGRISTVLLMLIAGLLATQLSSALSVFNIILQIGAGTGAIYLLRWFWWRVNAYSEITGMIVSLLVAIALLYVELDPSLEMIIAVGITTSSWLLVTLLTPATNDATLLAFYRKVKPYGSGWNAFREKMKTKGEDLPKGSGKFTSEILSVFAGLMIVYGLLFAIGNLLYSNYWLAAFLFILSLAGMYIILKSWKNIKFE